MNNEKERNTQCKTSDVYMGNNVTYFIVSGGTKDV